MEAPTTIPPTEMRTSVPFVLLKWKYQLQLLLLKRENQFQLFSLKWEHQLQLFKHWNGNTNYSYFRTKIETPVTVI